jgi:hypothetical protein
MLSRLCSPGRRNTHRGSKEFCGPSNQALLEKLNQNGRKEKIQPDHAMSDNDDQKRGDEYWDVEGIAHQLSGIRRSWRAAQTHHAEYGGDVSRDIQVEKARQTR